MPDIVEFWEEEILTKVSIKEYIHKFNPEIQVIFFNSYGKDLEAIPKEFLHSDFRTEYMLEQLLKLGSTRSQKIILMRFGIVTGTLMTLEEVANELEITRERVRQIESMFIRRCRPHIRRKKLIDYLND